MAKCRGIVAETRRNSPDQLPQPDEWREGKLASAATARAKGHRFGTICCRSRGYRRFPDLRISGRWLQRAGFDLGKHYEIEVRAGRLTIRAV